MVALLLGTANKVGLGQVRRKQAQVDANRGWLFEVRDKPHALRAQTHSKVAPKLRPDAAADFADRNLEGRSTWFVIESLNVLESQAAIASVGYESATETGYRKDLLGFNVLSDPITRHQNPWPYKSTWPTSQSANEAKHPSCAKATPVIPESCVSFLQASLDYLLRQSAKASPPTRTWEYAEKYKLRALL